MEGVMNTATETKEQGMASDSVSPKKVALIAADPSPQGQTNPGPVLRAASPVFVPALASGVLLWLCYFPTAWGWMSWFALVPFLGLVRARATKKRLFWAAYLGGTAFYWSALHWMPVADSRMYATWAMLATYCAFYFPAALALTRFLDRRTFLPLCLSFPIAWTALEFARSFVLTGFSWYYLGHTQHEWLPMIQVADVGGVYAISFLVAMVNAWLFDLAYQTPAVREMFRLPEPGETAAAHGPTGGGGLRLGLAIQGIAIASVLVINYGYGAWRIDQEKQFLEGPRIALLQGNQDIRIRNEAGSGNGGKALQTTAQHYAPLTAAAMKRHPHLIIWPETSYPARWYDSEMHELPPQGWVDRSLDIRNHLKKDLLRYCPTNHLLGISTEVANDENLPPGTPAVELHAKVRAILATNKDEGTRRNALLTLGFTSQAIDRALRTVKVDNRKRIRAAIDDGKTDQDKRRHLKFFGFAPASIERLLTMSPEQLRESELLPEESVYFADVLASPAIRRFNSALLLTEKGDTTHRFDKMHRIPFGEYVPLREVLPFMNVFSPYDYDYSILPGKTFTRFPLGDFRFGALICYEDSDPFLARRYVVKDADGEPVHFLVNQSNDGWFDGSSEHEEHLAVARFRAIECRRAVVRAVNMGVSAVIDGNGKVLRPHKVPVEDGTPKELADVAQWEIARSPTGELERLPASEWHEYKKVAGVLHAVVPIDQRTSLYAQYGDWLPQGGWCVIGVACVLAMFRRPRPAASPSSVAPNAA